LREKLQLVVEFVGNRVAYLGGDDSRSNNHSDEAKRNQKIMHGGVSWCGSAATVPHLDDQLQSRKLKYN
jgi:hypothetical protein